ncbi:MAG: GNAT family N-acetyltransferase [Arachnia sp.]
MRITLAQPRQLEQLAALETAFPTGQRWTRQLWADELTGGDRRVLVATDEFGSVVGAATFQLVAEVADLHRIVVAGQARRHGVAGRLLAEGIAWARREGAERVLLEVRADNTAALGLYRQAGFVELTTRADYYAPGVHAVVLGHEVGDRAQSEQEPS